MTLERREGLGVDRRARGRSSMISLIHFRTRQDREGIGFGVAYLRVSTGSQNLDNQKLAILDYARQKQLVVDRFVEAPSFIQSAKLKPDLA